MSLQTFIFFTFSLAESHVQLYVLWSQVFSILDVKGHIFWQDVDKQNPMCVYKTK